MGEVVVDAVVARGLYKAFEGRFAVDGMDLTVPRGSFYGIAGPNGAGKTTALRMIIGVLKPDGGDVVVDGVPVWPDTRAAKRRLGFVADNPAMFERLSGREMLEYAALLHGLDPVEADRRASELLQVLDLTADQGRMIADYSLGMRKRMGLAVALLHSPAVLILDEPFGSLDPVNTQVMEELLQRYRARGGTVVFSSHVMDVVERLCDRMVVMADGRARVEGTVADVRGAAPTLQQAFVDLVGGRDLGEGELSWLQSS
ncbi:ABC transporter ATP-binding protein [Demequina capsici]|uniref:ABC transporter ATP-binding protein n=1 Tax=Demequina capsici TaxID=3075620 RepID=A0AA96FDZ9_9MICO|nr:ABC transporter ATP-binding protein [Demequina sp. PMTSA13]WNM27760.1 ABC transporter ATP-binding protein [Demequina sp. PMTSA13]